MDISIIVPVYNASEYLKECIQSLLNQSKIELQILLVDDGSKDDSLTICRQFEKLDKRIKVLTQENNGPAAARNHALDYAESEWVLFVDSDDEIALDMCKTMYEVAQSTDADMVLCNMLNCFSGDFKKVCRPFYQNKQIEGTDLFLYEKMMVQRESETGEDSTVMTGPVCKLIRRSVIGDHRFPENLTMAEDVCFLVSFFPEIRKIVYVNENFYYRFIRENSLTYGRDEKMFAKMASYTLWMKAFYKNNSQMQESVNILEIKNLCDVIVNYLMDVNYPLADAVEKIKNYIIETGFTISIAKLMGMQISLKNKIIILLSKMHLYWMVRFMCSVKKVKRY